ncbi:MAG: pyridoxamine 5'-phosphate oxidase family protein [Rhizobiales bacterium]|nr:pyridoxamine 5'-phosphate oxidase family protein [Hyphomicrobiales bacterium]
MSGRAPLPDWYDDLSGSLNAAWGAMTRGALDRRSAFHHPVIATIGPDGWPRQRVMILRAVDPEMRSLRFHTDIRSEKARDIAAEPRVSVLAYDPASKIQLRLNGQATLHHADHIADAAWQGSQRMSRACYGTMPGPGSVIGQGSAFSLPDTSDETALETGRANFVAMLVRVERLEWLYLAYEGHRRAQFEWNADGKVSARWLAP